MRLVTLRPNPRRATPTQFRQGFEVFDRYFKIPTIIFFSFFISTQLALALVVKNSVSLQQEERYPASQEDSFSIAQRARFYLKLMPQQQQVESAIEPADYATSQQACFQTGYGSWAKPMKSTEELSQRYSFLISKLNRPFYFQFVPRNDSKLHIIGSLDDFREMICVGLVLNDGKTGDEAVTRISSEFIQAVLRLPNINSQVLDLMLNLWDKSDRALATGQGIVTHPLFNQFNLRDLIGSLFKKTDAIGGTKRFAPDDPEDGFLFAIFRRVLLSSFK